MERVINETLDSVTMRSCDYLYNLDGGQDYIYVEFEEGGYAILLKQTLELLEYSYSRNISYPSTGGDKYYGGPGVYLSKTNNCFVNHHTGQSIEISKENATIYAQSIRNTFGQLNQSIYDDKEVVIDASLDSYNLTNMRYSSAGISKNSTSSVPVIDRENYITGLPVINGTYIENFWYFLLDPKHGENENGSCNAIATQLLLSYHNYYSDRRIIANENLNGSNAITEKHLNPNFCEDPMSMTSATLGSRGEKEDGSDDPNSYFAMIVDAIPIETYTADIVNGINTLLSSRNNELTNDIDFDVITDNDLSGAYEEIDAGFPVIIGMQEHLGGINHRVVAYGYQNYTYPGSTTQYSGFIAHFGWDADTNNVWINSAWCLNYITLKINHVHSHTQNAGEIGVTGANEHKCAECGHRTDEIVNISGGNRYTERVTNILPNTYKEYKVTFSTSGNRIIQTFGAYTLDHDGYIEILDSNGNVLDCDDDSGYEYNALLSYNFIAGEQYTIRLSYVYPDEQSGVIKLAIVPANSCDSYDDIYSRVDSFLGYAEYFEQYKVNILTYKFSVTQDLVMTAKSNVDTYLYIIDPRSTDYITAASGLSTKTSDNLYNNDYAADTQNSQITKTFEANIPYFVVVSAYDPSSSLSVGKFRLVFP